mmetsp:Transcript_5730/g.17564  ORF Transcript_5730/g.17564 Transcript_5730/m.17564 type:complete len:209 (-) Transcript_5730:154-780(-)
MPILRKVGLSCMGHKKHGNGCKDRRTTKPIGTHECHTQVCCFPSLNNLAWFVCSVPIRAGETVARSVHVGIVVIQIDLGCMLVVPLTSVFECMSQVHRTSVLTVVILAHCRRLLLLLLLLFKSLISEIRIAFGSIFLPLSDVLNAADARLDGVRYLRLELLVSSFSGRAVGLRLRMRARDGRLILIQTQGRKLLEFVLKVSVGTLIRS